MREGSRVEVGADSALDALGALSLPPLQVIVVGVATRRDLVNFQAL